MKKRVLLILTVLLLSGCGQQKPEQTTVPTTQAATAPTTAPTTVPTTEPTTAPTTAPIAETTEPAAPALLSPEVWKPKASHLSYKAYFSQNQWFDQWEIYSWIVSGENGGYRCELNTWPELTVSCDAYSGHYTVPRSGQTLEKYGNPQFLGTDGRIACFANETQIISIDLETGDDTVLVTAEKLQDVYYLGGVLLFYIRYEFGDPVICRFHIPEARENVIRSLEEPWRGIRLLCPDSNLGKVEWTSFHPEMVALVEAALKDPNSTYKTADVGLGVPSLWKLDDPFADPGGPALLRLMELIQADTQVSAMRKGSFDCRTGEYTVLQGKLEDGCCYGSVYPHDHYAENDSGLPLPKEADSTEQAFSVEALPREWDALIYTSASRLIQEQGYFITDKNTVVFLPGNGGCPEVVYTAQFGRLRDPHFQKLNGMGDTEWLCLLDGNRLVAVDTENMVYKVLIRNNYMIGCMDWGDGRIYFELEYGMYYQGYIYDPEAGSFEPKRIL